MTDIVHVLGLLAEHLGEAELAWARRNTASTEATVVRDIIHAVRATIEDINTESAPNQEHLLLSAYRAAYREAMVCTLSGKERRIANDTSDAELDEKILEWKREKDIKP